MSEFRETTRGRQLSFLLLFCVFAASVWGLASVSAKRIPKPSDGAPSLGALLKPDGTLDLSRGFQGSLDTQGYRMEYSAGGAPRFVPAAPAAGTWDTQFVNANGVQRVANAVAVIGTDVYLGGQFTTAGTTVVNNIARWDGSSWSSLGSGVVGAVYTMAVSGGDLYVGGDFTMAGGAPASNIAKWNGSSWSALGSGVSGGSSDNVLSLAVSGGNVYVGGQFTTAGGAPAANIAKWNGSAWSALGSGTSGQVEALAVNGGDLYAGGQFLTAGGNPVVNIAKWNGSAWSALGGGIPSQVRALAISGSDLYAGGQFATAGGVPANNIAKWNGSAWSSLGSGVTANPGAAVGSVLAVGANVYVNGTFDTAGGNPAKNVAVWNGSAWAALGNGLENGGLTLYGLFASLAASGTDIYAAGAITKSGNVEINRIAKWNGSAWSPIGNATNSVNNAVYALAVMGNDVYVAGEFDFAGGVAANNIAKWNGTTWSALGSGLNLVAFSMAVMGSDLYVSGYFSTAGGNPANYIAKWNGSAWSPLGSGLNNGAVSLVVSGTNLYAGGGFSTAGGITVNGVACWNGSSWSALGSGMNPSSVRALAVNGSDLYAGGNFMTAGGIPASRIAKWNGSMWSALGSGLNDTVNTLGISGTDVYAGGRFTQAGGNATGSLAKWNGSVWSQVGGGVNGEVQHLLLVGNDLYVGGLFTIAGGNTYAGVAKWDGSAWATLSAANSIDDIPYALAWQGANLYAGGVFTTLGGTISHYFGRFGCFSTVVTNSNDSGPGSLRQIIADACPDSTITFQADVTTVTLTSDELVINKNLTIEGSSGVIVTRQTGSPNFRIFEVTAGNTATFNSLTITNGNHPTQAGGVQNSGTLTLNNCVISGNIAGQSGGLQNDNVMLINNCTISNNTDISTFSGGGGGISNYGSSLTITDSTIANNTCITEVGGGISHRAGALTVSNSIFSGNSAGTSGGAIYSFSGGSANMASLTNCTFSGNSAGTSGGALFLGSQAPLNTASLTNCTFSGNSATAGGAIASLSTIPINGLTLTNCTLTLNRANSGGGIHNPSAMPILRNTLVVGNTKTDGTSVSNISGGLNASSTSNITTNSGVLLAPLGNYGGPTQTHALLPGSAGINAGTAASAPATDQRGVARLGNVDIGAFESRGFTLVASGGNSQSAAAGSAFASPLSVTVSSTNSEPVNGGQITFTQPGSGAGATIAGNPATITGGTATTGVVTANTITGGPYNVSANGNGAGAAVSFSLTNICPTINVLNPVTTSGTVFSVFSQTFTQSGGIGMTTFSTTSILPTGLSLSTAGVLSGTPTQTGNFPIIIRATDQNGCVGAGTAYNLSINPVACISSLTVNNTGDGADATPGNGVCETANGNGICTLRAALMEANALTNCSPLAINFAVTGTINLNTELPSLYHPDLTLNGPGAQQLTVRCNAASSFSIFTVDDNSPSVKKLTVNGLTLRDSDTGIGVVSGGQVTVNNCIVTNNQIGLSSLGDTSLTVNHSAISGNIGGDAFGGAIIITGGILTMTNSTISDNTTTGTGDFQASALLLGTGSATLTNCTISGNTGKQTIAQATFAGIANSTLTLTNCTVAGNTLSSVTTAYGVLDIVGDNTFNSTLQLKNTLVAGNNVGIGANFRTATGSTVTSLGNNLDSDGSSGFTNGVNGNLVGTLANPLNALLAPLGNYGGSTQTIALLPGSPAINAGTVSSAPATDQRGIARVGNTDIGAFESRGFTLAASSGNNQSTPVSTAFAQPLSVTVTSENSEPVNGGKVTFTPPVSGASATIAGNPATIAGGAATSGLVTANSVVGAYNVAASANGANPVNFSLTNLNTAPGFTPALAIDRQQGSPAGAAVTIGTVSDAQMAAGSLAVTQIAGGTATGINVTGISNTTGIITAIVSANCNAVGGTVRFQVSDGDLTGTGDLTVNVTANSAPSVTYANVSVNAGASTTNSTATATDNGSINSFAVQDQGSYTGTISVNASGTVSISNAAPVGTHTIRIRAADNCGATTDANFTLTVGNNLPTITAGIGINRQQGSAGSTATIATVNDNDTPAANLIVTATTVPTGITITSITNTNGTINASVAAGCNATVGTNTVVLTVTDSNSGTATANLTVNVEANAAPSLSYPVSGVALNSATAINPTTATDNGSITGYQIVSVTPPLTVAPTVNSSGVVSVTDAGPFGLHTVTVRATDNCGATTEASFTLNVGCGSLTVNPATLINGLTFVPYSSTLSASGGSGSYTFTLVSGTLPAGLSLGGDTISGTPNTAGASTFTIRATDGNGCFGERSYTLLIGSTGLMYYPLARPVRLLDTRPGASANACFQPNAPIPGGTSRLQPARGTCEGLTIPPSATTITGNITTVQSGGGFLAIYPSDAPPPLVANSNYLPSEIVNNSFTVGVGAADGAVKISVTTDTDVVVDVTGYYAPPTTGGLYFHPLPRPVRLLETRQGFTGCFAPATPLPGGVNTTQQGTGSCQGLIIPAEALALVGNATTVNPSALGYLTLYPADAAQPLVASSNYGAGQTVNGPFTVGLSPSGQFKIFPQWTTDLVIDITGYYSAQANDANGQGLLYSSLGSPLRLLDTRAGLEGCYTPGAAMVGGTVYTQETQSPCTNLTPTARALIGNATVVNTADIGYLTFWPGDAQQPLVATSNYVAGQVINRYFTVGLGPDGSFKRFASSTTNLVVDISGFFAP